MGLHIHLLFGRLKCLRELNALHVLYLIHEHLVVTMHFSLSMRYYLIR